MRFAAIASVVILGLTTAGIAQAQTPPKRSTLTGKISVLKLKQITVNGKGKLTCRVTTTSPKLRGFVLGTSAKITCVRGVLATIKKLPATAMTTPASPGVTNDGTITGNTDKNGDAGAFTVNPALSLVGTGTITALGGGSITLGGKVTCGLNRVSPSIAAFHVGDRVDYECASGLLTRISTAL